MHATGLRDEYLAAVAERRKDEIQKWRKQTGPGTGDK